MGSIRSLVGFALVLLVGAGLGVGAHLAMTREPRSAPATLTPQRTPSPSPQATSAPPSAPSPVPPPETQPQPQPQPQSPPQPPAPPTAPGPPAVMKPRHPASGSTEKAQVGTAQRRAALRKRLRHEAIQLCERWGFPRARCETAPR